MPANAIVPAIQHVPLTLNQTSAAAQNVANIQAALNVGGAVYLTGNGICWINATLVIGSNTRLVVDPSLTIKQVSQGASATNMLVSAAYQRAWTNVTAAWTSGLSATVTWTAHGLSKGDPVWMTGPSESAYLGVFRVLSVTDANTFVVLLKRTPSASPVGQVKIKVADQNIELSGGTWNYFYSSGQSAADSPLLFALIFAGVANLYVHDISGTDSSKYVFHLTAVRNYRLDGVTTFNTNSDGVKIIGPAFNGVVQNCDLQTNDDSLSCQTDNPAAFSQYNITGQNGDVLDLKFKNINGASTVGSAAVVYMTSGSYTMDAIEIDGVSGRAASSSFVRVTDSGLGGRVRSLTLKNIDHRDTLSSTPISIESGQIDRLEIDGVHWSPNLSAAPSNGGVISVSSGATVNLMLVRGVNAYFPSVTINAVVVAGTVNQLLIGQSTFDAGSVGALRGRIFQFLSTAIVNKADIRDCRLIGLLQIGDVTTSTGTNAITLQNIEGDISSGVVYSAPGTLKVGGLDISGATNGVCRPFGSSSVTVTYTSGGGNRLTGGSVFLNAVNGTEVITVQSLDIQVDVTKVARASGSLCYNTNAAAGTLGSAGSVVCQGTASGSWKLLANTSLTY